MALTKVTTEVIDDSIRISSGSLNVISGSSISTGSFGRLQTHQANALLGSSILTLGGNLSTAGTLTTQNNNVTINAAGAARTLTLTENLSVSDGQNVVLAAAGQENTFTMNESFTIGDGNSGTLTFSGASKTLTVEDTSVVNQDLTSDASPTFAGGTVTGNFTVGGTLTAQEIHTEFTSASIVFTSGSTTFGDTADDVHERTGSLNISGSLTLNDGTLTVTDDLSVDGTTNLDNTDIDGTLTVDGGNIVFNEDSADQDFRVESNGDTHMFFVDGGNNKVGIGTNNPGRTLHIYNSSQAEIKLNTSGASNGGLIYYNDSETQFLIRAQESDGNITFQTGGTTERMRINSSGNVGIGTTSPGNNSILHVSASATGGSDSDVVISNTKTTAQFHRGLLVLHPNISNTHSGMIMFGNAESSGNSGHISFVNNSSDGSEAIRIGIFAKDDLVTVTGAGDVGIGLTNPTVKLHVKEDNSSDDAQIKVENDGTGDAGIAFLLTGTRGYSMGIDNSDGDKFIIGGDDNAIGTTPYLTIDHSNKNVGIDTTSPSRDFVISNGGAGGIEFGAGDTSSVMSLFNRSNSSYTNLDIEAATVDFLTGTGADKQVSIDASGQLGIGTNAPASRIDVRDASHRGLRFISKTTTSVSGGAAATTIGNVSFAHETNGDGAGVLIDAIVTVRSSQSANHTSVRSLPFRCVMVRPGANSGGDSTRIKATTVSTNDGTTGTAFAELGSASTISSVSMSFLTSNASTGEGTCQIRATTVIDSGTANSIDFVGTMVGKADVTFS